MNESQNSKKVVKEESDCLWHVSIWDWTHDCDTCQEPYGYAVVAGDIENAAELALEIHNAEKGQENQDTTMPDAMKRRSGVAVVDYSQSYQITCAINATGQLYDVVLVKENKV